MDTRRLSLLKPTGHLGLGHLLGALRPMAAGQSRADCFFGIADLHALTVRHDPSQIRAYQTEMAALLLAVGLDRSTLFVQSRVRAPGLRVGRRPLPGRGGTGAGGRTVRDRPGLSHREVMRSGGYSARTV
jgi:hypothetical protein